MKVHFIGTLLITASIVGSCTRHSKHEIAATAINVYVSKPIIDSIIVTRPYAGYITSKSSVTVVARVDGTLLETTYRPGEYVEAGTPLFVIEHTYYDDAVAQAEAQLKSALSAHEYADSNYNSILEAAAANAVARINVVQAHDNLIQASASIDNSRAALETAKKNQEYCYIKAPIAGHITKPIHTKGAYISGTDNATELATIYDDATVYANFSISNDEYTQLADISDRSLLNNIYIGVADLPDRKFTGALEYVAPNVNMNTGTVSMRVSIDNTDGALKDGMYITVNLPIADMRSAMLINDSAIGTNQLGKYIYTVNDSNIVALTPIEISDTYHDTLRIVESGITPNSRYITKAMLKVRPGEKINPITQ